MVRAMTRGVILLAGISLGILAAALQPGPPGVRPGAGPGSASSAPERTDPGPAAPEGAHVPWADPERPDLQSDADVPDSDFLSEPLERRVTEELRRLAGAAGFPAEP